MLGRYSKDLNLRSFGYEPNALATKLYTDVEGLFRFELKKNSFADYRLNLLATTPKKKWQGKTDSNHHLLVLETSVLSLNDSPIWWERLDSNQRSENAQVLQTRPIAARELSHIVATISENIILLLRVSLNFLRINESCRTN